MSVAPLQFLLLVFAGWVNRRQCDIVAYLREENRVLREQIGDRRLRFTHAQRRRLAVKGRILGRRVLEQLAGLVTPDTILRWYRELIATKYDGTAQRGGSRRGTVASLQRLVIRFKVRDHRGLLRTALGYAHRQRGPLTRFYDDGRLRLDNNRSERELRRIVSARP